MAQLGARQDTSCPVNRLWYVCTKGPFQGCCSVDPCTSGMCPDENSNLTTLRTATAATATTTVTITQTATESTAFTGSVTITSRQTSSIPIASTSTSPEAGNALPTSSPTSTQITSAGHNHAGLIGGIVGGVTAAMALISLIAYLIYRSRKKRGKRFTLLRWRHGFELSQEAVEVNNNSINSGYHINPSRTSPTTQGQTQGSESSSSPEADDLTLSTSHHNPIPIHALHILNARLTTGRSTPTLMSSTSMSTSASTSSTSSSASTYPNQNQYQNPTSCSNSTSSTTPGTGSSSYTPEPHESTPELFDTGFYRTRAELPATSCRELINIPLSQRQGKAQIHTHTHTQTQSYMHTQTRNPAFNSPVTPLVTLDGAVLTANFDRDVQGEAYPEGRNHATSFMHFGAVDEAVLPVYRDSWGRV